MHGVIQIVYTICTVDSPRPSYPPFLCAGGWVGLLTVLDAAVVDPALREKVPALPIVALAFRSSIFLRSISSCAVSYRSIVPGKVVRTTFLTRVNAAVSPATSGRQSSTRYGGEMITASATTMLVLSHLAGVVRLNASNRPCASRVTPFPRRASPSCALVTAAASRAFRARVSSA